MGQTVIEINGVKYDATTGSVIVSQTTSQPTQTVTKQTGQNIDGIVSNHKAVVAHKPATTFKPSIDRVVRDITMVHHKHPAKSKTLMRTVVRKPGAATASSTNTHIPAASNIKQTTSYAAASSHDSRLTRALSTPTHGGVARFNLSPTTKIQPSITHMPVATQAPQVATSQQGHPHQPKHVKQGATDFVNAQLAKQANDEQVSPFKKKRLGQRMSTALKGNKLKSIAAGSMATLLIGGFIVYQNLPTISLAFANKNAGMAARIPKGIPSNFAIDRSIDASKGQVTLVFASRNDDRRFTITQQTTDMSPSQLEEALANSNNKGIQSYESNGIKLFITGPGEADWIDGDVRINVSGTSGLSSEQLATIARSL